MSKVIKVWIMMMIAVVIGFGGNEKALAASNFKDVSVSHWAKQEVEYLYNKGIISGYTESGVDLFKPESKVTRAQAAKMLVLAKGQSELNVAAPSFRDVPTSHWASGWVERAYQLGYFSGKDNGSFDPEGLLTRAQMSKVLAFAFDMNIQAAEEKEMAFTDVTNSYWAASYINTLYYTGISNGSGDQFNPNNDITRAQFSAFLSRTLNEEFRLPLLGNPIAKAKATVNDLNVRSAPTTKGAVLGQLHAGDVVPVYEINKYWTKISFNGKEAYVHKTYLKIVNLDKNPLKDRLIVIDAGHGDGDPGAINGNVQEKNITLSVSKLVKQKLENSGAKIIMTRQSDTYPTLEDRVRIAENSYAELFVSIHVNAATAAAKGAETFYNTSHNDNSAESYDLALEIQKQIIQLTDMYDRGVKDGPWFVIKEQEIPAVLVELGFISNYGDLLKLTSAQYQNLYAEAIYRGIKNYYSYY
jgi:N-acetylmuramoyl-L-alanine amidase